MAAVMAKFRSRCCLVTSRWRFTSSSSAFSCPMRSWIKRRSTSSFFSPGPLVPVSYTHLDVYKRQNQSLGGAGSGGIGHDDLVFEVIA